MARPSRRSLSRSCAALIAVGAAASAYGQFNYTETFKNSTASGWDFYTGDSSPGPRLTSGAAPVAGDPEYGKSTVIDPTGQGWLRLATATNNQANAAYFDSALPSANNNIVIKFSVAMWGDNGIGSGGDGLTFFMRDASTPMSTGAFGGSIGYAQKTGINGVAGGYFGVALDVYGNYSNPTEGRQGGVGSDPNAVVVRGPGSGQSGYNYLAGTGGYNYTATGNAITRDSGDPSIAALPYQLSSPTATSRPNQTTGYRNVEIDLSSTSQLTVKMQFGEDGKWRTVLTADMSSFSRPDMMSFGFTSGTGDANQVYEVGNSFSVTADAASNSSFWDNGATTKTGQWGTAGDSANNWTNNANPATYNNVFFNDSYVSTNQTVTLTTSQTVGSVYFSGKDSYTLNSSSSSNQLVLDTGKGSTSTSYISVTQSNTGTANNTINAATKLDNNLKIDNYAAGNTLTLAGAINGQNHDITIQGTGTTVISGGLSNVGTLTKLDGGVLNFSNSATVSNLVLSGGTLLLNSSTLLATSLHVTANSVIDFGTLGSSILNLTSLTIDSGVTLTITDWTAAQDYFYLTNQPTSGTLSQIVFAGMAPTGWNSFTKEVRPVPEPSTYGLLMMLAIVLGFFGLRWNQERQTAMQMRRIPVRVRETRR
ncbi:MAG TPA: PEP-CTERM sorting domain-containing protein [Opitutaceae bacterium]